MSPMVDFEAVTGSVAALVTAAAAVVAVLIWLSTRAWRPTMPVLLEMLLAAGLLRLSAHDDWSVIGGAAAIVVIRTLVKSSGNRDTSSGPPRPQAFPWSGRASLGAPTTGAQ